MEQANFDQILEQDIARISRELQELKGRYEANGKEQIPPRELLKESLQSMGGTGTVVPLPQKPAASSKGEEELLPSYMLDAPADVKLQVEELLDISIHKGIETAVKQAKKDDPYVLDAFHDALVEKLYPELQKRGLFK